MKNFLLLVTALILSVSTTSAQDAAKAVKKAGKLLASYHLDPKNNGDKLDEARGMIDEAMLSDEVAASSKGWNTKGDIYAVYANNHLKATIIDPAAKPKVKGAGLTAFESFKKGLDHAVKGYDKKDALKGMGSLANDLNSLGYSSYQAGDYNNAYKHFDAVIQINELVKANDMKPILGNDEAYLDQLYITAVSAMSGNNMEGAKSYFLILKDKGFDKPAIYDGLYKAFKDNDEEKAVGYLAEGREKHPSDASLLFSEINHYLKKGELDNLIAKLEAATKLEPDNASIFTTLGNVYDQQYQEALETDDREKTEALFEKAFINYKTALEKNPGDFSATYSLGALYYNKAAACSKEVNSLADDYSSEGTKKYEAKKAEMFGLFEKALPYFLEAEKIKSDDRNTLVALKEIYARKDMFEQSNEYKAKIEALEE